MDALYEKYALTGWRRVTKLVSVSVGGSASASATLTSDGDRKFAIVEIGEGHTGAYTFGIVSNQHEQVPVVATGVTGTAFFGASNALPLPFPREIEPNEIWTLSVTDTSTAANVIVFCFHGYIEPPEGARAERR